MKRKNATAKECAKCKGRGRIDPPCDTCEGYGRVDDPSSEYSDGTMDCPDCRSECCPACDGSGEVTTHPQTEEEVNRHEEMARAACDALGLKFEEASPAEIKARVYEMWDGLNARLAEPVTVPHRDWSEFPVEDFNPSSEWPEPGRPTIFFELREMSNNRDGRNRYWTMEASVRKLEVAGEFRYWATPSGKFIGPVRHYRGKWEYVPVELLPPEEPIPSAGATDEPAENSKPVNNWWDYLTDAPKTLGDMKLGELCEFTDRNGTKHFVQVASTANDGNVTVVYEDGMMAWLDADNPATPVIELTVAATSSGVGGATQEEIDKMNIRPPRRIPVTRPKFRAVQWNPEERDRRLRELVEMYGGHIRYEEGGIEINGLLPRDLCRVQELIEKEFPGSGPPSREMP